MELETLLSNQPVPKELAEKLRPFSDPGDPFLFALIGDLNQQGAYDKTGDILNPAVSVRMLPVRPFPRKHETKECDHRGACIGKVVECVSRDGHGSGYCSGDEFGYEQNYVQADTVNASQCSI